MTTFPLSTSSHLLPDNLTPAERKKLKSKQRKKELQEAAKKEKLKQDEQLKQQANKTKVVDPELEGPKEEELNPDKLARVGFELSKLLHFLFIM